MTATEPPANLITMSWRVCLQMAGGCLKAQGKKSFKLYGKFSVKDLKRNSVISSTIQMFPTDAWNAALRVPCQYQGKHTKSLLARGESSSSD